MASTLAEAPTEGAADAATADAPVEGAVAGTIVDAPVEGALAQFLLQRLPHLINSAVSSLGEQLQQEIDPYHGAIRLPPSISMSVPQGVQANTGRD